VSETDYGSYVVAGTRLLTSGTGERYQFDPGMFCLELLLTGGPGPYQRYEILRGVTDLVAWLVDSRLAAVAPLEVGDIRIRPAELARLTDFRDTLWSVAKAVAAGNVPERSHLELINTSAADAMRPEIDLTTSERRWSGPITGAQVLGTAAREAIDLVSGPSASRLRECGADDCQLLFFDTSRPGNRRWCSMQRCGNRHKVNAYRVRHQD
jgi:predicted RNA-binding Zn ribbon-like protein